MRAVLGEILACELLPDLELFIKVNKLPNGSLLQAFSSTN